MEEKKEFGLFIKQKRQEMGYSQKDLSEKLFVTESAVSKWERGISYPDITMVSNLCSLLNISEHELVTASDDIELRKIKKYAKSFKKIKSLWFAIPTISYFLTIIICFICNLAVNHTLSWFFVVFASLLCAFSFVPSFCVFTEKNKLSVFIFTTAASIVLLLLTCGIYTKTAFWVPTAVIGTLMGYTAVFMPILLTRQNNNLLLKKASFLITVIFLILFSVLLLFSIYVMTPFNIKSSVLMTLYGFTPLFLTAIICFFKTNGFIKSGLSVGVFGVFSYFVENIIVKLFGEKYANAYLGVDFTDWANHTNGNVDFLILLSCAAISLTFLVIGIIKLRKKP